MIGADMSNQSPNAETDGFAERLRLYAHQAGLNLTQLADRAGLSKGYLSTLMSGQANTRPSGETLYALAEALGVTMSDLLGRRLLTEAHADIPKSLAAFAAQARLPQADVAMLASIQFRGDRPKTVDRWRYIYQAIRGSASIDEA
jgi:transcriptional regulator with XRE-family HTH domain